MSPRVDEAIEPLMARLATVPMFLIFVRRCHRQAENPAEIGGEIVVKYISGISPRSDWERDLPCGILNQTCLIRAILNVVKSVSVFLTIQIYKCFIYESNTA